MGAWQKPFRSKQDAQSRANRIWICAQCKTWHGDKPVACPRCQCKTYIYCQSKREAERAAQLMMLQQYGEISNLEFQPSYEFTEDGEVVFTYRADFRYVNSRGETVVEDTKGSKSPKSWDPVFVLKKKLIEARYRIEIIIVTGR